MLLVRSATILTMNDALDIIEGDVLVQDGRIVGIGRGLDAPGGKVIDAGGDFLLPGFMRCTATVTPVVEMPVPKD